MLKAELEFRFAGSANANLNSHSPVRSCEAERQHKWESSQKLRRRSFWMLPESGWTDS